MLIKISHAVALEIVRRQELGTLSEDLGKFLNLSAREYPRLDVPKACAEVPVQQHKPCLDRREQRRLNKMYEKRAVR